MAQMVVSSSRKGKDEAFQEQLTGALCGRGRFPVSVLDERAARGATPADLVIVDTRGERRRRCRARAPARLARPALGIVAIAAAADFPDLILQFHACGGPTRFFTWPPDEENIHGAVGRRQAAAKPRRAPKPSARRRVLRRPKDGAGTTTLSVNCGVSWDASASDRRHVDLKPGLGATSRLLPRHAPALQPARRESTTSPA